MEVDWMVLFLLVSFVIFCAQIFLVYRRQAGLLKPTVDQLEEARVHIEAQVADSERVTEEINQQTHQMQLEFALLEERRSELQEKLSTVQMILIPSGEFKMGEDEEGATDEYPMHSVLLNVFLIDKYPVTNIDYRKFVEITGHRPPPHWVSTGGIYPLDQADYPVVNISWHDATAYAKWVGKRLPTEAEWEKAARGTRGQVYPWGDAFRKDNINCNNEFQGPTSVMRFSQGRSPYGVMDMCGNISEWVEDWYFDEYYRTSPLDNPTGPAGSQYKVVRGGFFGENKAGVRCASRHWSPPAAMQEHVGFRCAKSQEK